MAEMKVGDIGVLQNLHVSGPLIRNGDIAEILSIFETWCGNCGQTENGYAIKIFSSPKPLGNYGNGFHVLFNEIRPITDPDAEQSIEQEQELTV